MVVRPVIPTAPPPRDEGYSSGGSPPTSSASGRGAVRPHSASPFMRSVRQRLEEQKEEVDLEAVSCLLNFSTRNRGGPRPQTPGAQVTVSSFVIEETSGTEGGTSATSVMVRTFSASPPTTPASAPRPDRPPPIISGRRQSGHLVRPRPLRRSLEEQERELRGMVHTCHACPQSGSAPSAALGAPPRQEEEEGNNDDESLDLPDLPETPASPATSDITVIRLVEKRNFFGKKIIFF